MFRLFLLSYGLINMMMSILSVKGAISYITLLNPKSVFFCYLYSQLVFPYKLYISSSKINLTKINGTSFSKKLKVHLILSALLLKAMRGIVILHSTM